MSELTPAFWPTRILLWAGFIVTAVVVALSLLGLAAGPMTGDWVSIAGLRIGPLISVAASGMALTGLAWMLRIFRGPRDEPPPWRYRDR